MKKKRKKTLYICTQTRDILPSCPVGGVHTCSVVSFLSHHLTWWKVRLMKKKILFYMRKKMTLHHVWLQILIHKMNYLSSQVYCYCNHCSTRGMAKGWGGGSIIQEERRKHDTQKARQEVVAVSEGLDHNQASGTLILPSPLCGHRDNVGSRLPGFTDCSSQPLSYSLRHSRCKNNNKKNINESVKSQLSDIVFT